MESLTTAALPNPAALLAQDVVAVVATARHYREPLLPAEAGYVASRFMQPRREAEFRAGRACAREALAQLGVCNWPLIPGPTREPRWPPGVVGSITHAEGYCAAAVASADVCGGLGIDVEAIGRVGEAVAGLICGADELCRLDDCDAATRRVRLALLFSAKESVFKAVFPAERIVFEPADIEVAFEWDNGTFAIQAPAQRALDAICAQLDGRFAIVGAHVMTTAWRGEASALPRQVENAAALPLGH